MANAQINPLLIQCLTNKEITEIPDSPTISWLTGKYAKLINKQKDSIRRLFEENPFMLTCTSCGRKGKYDVGLMVINADSAKKEQKPEKCIQTTGYFRCKHCNDAGYWEMPKQFLMMSITGMLMKGSSDAEQKCTVGENQLYDGSWHLFSSDAETHLLHKLSADPNNSFIWNRLGNLYHKGSHPELAASAFEHSIAIDPSQTESHFTLGGLLLQIDEYEKSSYHFKQMLLSANNYQSMPAEELQQMLATGLQDSFFIYQHSNGEIPFLPTKEELETFGRLEELENNSIDMEREVFPEETESFFPFAEIYMGSQSKKLSNRLRTVKTQKPTKKVKKRHKKNKRK